MRRVPTIRTWGGKWQCCAALAPWLFLGFHPAAPVHAPSSLIAWRDEKIDWILQPRRTLKGPVLSRAEIVAKCSLVLDELHARYGGDLRVLHEIPGADAELATFLRFVTAQHWLGIKDVDGNSTHLLGSSQSDVEYLNSIRPYVMPSGLLADQAFLKALQSPNTYCKAVEMIDAQNRAKSPEEKWLTVTFRAQFILSVDATTFGRLLVVVPTHKLPDGSEIEQWFQFALASPTTPPGTMIRSVSCIARVRKKDGQTAAYFVDLYRTRDSTTGETTFVPTYLLKPMPSSDCLNCHKTAVLPLYPKSMLVCSPSGVTEAPADGNRAVEAANARMLAWYGVGANGKPAPAHERMFADTDDYGPSLGSGDAARLDAALAAVSAEDPLSPESVARVRAEMRCTTCHGAFAPLNYDLSTVTDRDSFAFESKRGLAQTFIENGYMPPGNDLTPAERKILWRALARAYYDPQTRRGTLVDWLKGLTPSPH